MHRFSLVLFFLLLAKVLPAHQCSNDQCAQQHIESARELIAQETPVELAVKDSVLLYCQAASRYFFDAQNLLLWLEAVEQCAFIHNAYNEPFAALDSMKKVQQLVSNAKIPQWYYPANPEQWQRYCDFLLLKAWFAKYVNNFIQVKSDTEEALIIFRDKLGGGNKDNARFIFLELGNAYVRLGDYAAAQPVFEQGITYARVEKAPEVAKFNDYGSLFLSQKKYEDALAIFERGLGFDNLNNYQRIFLHLNIADALAHLKRYDQAMAANKKAEAMLQKFQNDLSAKQFNRCHLGIYENYGIISAGTGAFQESLQWYDKALEIVQQNSGQQFSTREMAGYIIEQANVYYMWGKYHEALEKYQQALHCLLPTFSAPAIDNPEPKLFYAEKMLIEALEGKALCFDMLESPEKALACYELIPEVEKKLRAAHVYESSSLIALEESRRRFENAIDLVWKLYTQTGNTNYINRAFHLTEESRGMLLYQTLTRAQLESDLLDSSSRQQEYDLSIKISYWEQELVLEQSKGAKADSARISELAQLHDALVREQEQFRNKLRLQFREYAQLSDLMNVLRAEDVPGLLRSDQALMNFFMTQQAVYVFYFEESGWFSWLFGKKKPQWRRVPLDEDFRTRLHKFTQMLSKGDQLGREEDQWLLQESHTLYALLMADIDKKTPESLIIIPDVELAFIPFEMLLRKPVEGNWRTNLPFLVRDLNISYAYSATLLQLQNNISNNRKSTASVSFAGFAPAYSAGVDSITGGLRDTIPDVPSTRDQVNTVNNIWGDGTTWLGTNCTENSFRQIARNCRIILLAMHGFADSENPELARLRFGDPRAHSSDKTDDNILTANEIQIMRLQADLIILSACHSGQGRLSKGEGVFSLARAFTAAGIPAAVMSQWRLHGDAANLIITRFFEYLKKGENIDVALSLAKRNFLDNNQEQFGSVHPYYWAGLKAIGNMDALSHQRTTPPILWVALPLLLLTFIWVTFKRRRASTA